MGRHGKDVNPLAVFGSFHELPDDLMDAFDVDWFCSIQNKQVAEKRYNFLRNPVVIHQFVQHGYAGEPIERMWKAVLRACVSYGIPLAAHHEHLAEEYGVVIPEG